ncbi:hypothetical protein I553_0952 [Mycobacterium xenopi 4042]|uniref:Uncharacterized protein n=1 Tax=Mycobacterium xenopi 4042 TaxID=1299334 RepID=X7Z8Z0_MYCXE|nr:hypothetical protein I553_0952 [Mycobacterium xenopi 4042]
MIAAMMFWALPTGAALNARHVLLLNVVTASIYSAISIPGDRLGLLLADDLRQCRRRHRRAHNPRRAVADGRDSRNGLADSNTGHGCDQRKNTPLATTVGPHCSLLQR